MIPGYRRMAIGYNGCWNCTESEESMHTIKCRKYASKVAFMSICPDWKDWLKEEKVQ